MVIIRQEQPADVTAIRNITEQAFGRPAEARLIVALRARGQITLSLVAEQANYLLGHCLFSPVALPSAGRAWALLGLGPMAVLPLWQRRGIGSRLVMHGLEHCRRQG
jgi:putative acetyltransferase